MLTKERSHLILQLLIKLSCISPLMEFLVCKKSLSIHKNDLRSSLVIIFVCFCVKNNHVSWLADVYKNIFYYFSLHTHLPCNHVLGTKMATFCYKPISPPSSNLYNIFGGSYTYRKPFNFQPVFDVKVSTPLNDFGKLTLDSFIYRELSKYMVNYHL